MLSIEKPSGLTSTSDIQDPKDAVNYSMPIE